MCQASTLRGKRQGCGAATRSFGFMTWPNGWNAALSIPFSIGQTLEYKIIIIYYYYYLIVQQKLLWYDWELSPCLPWTHNSLCIINGTFSMAGIWWQNFTTWAKILPADGWNYSELNVIHEKRLQLFSSPDESGRCIGIRANLYERKECYRNNKLISYPFTESTREQKRGDY